MHVKDMKSKTLIGWAKVRMNNHSFFCEIVKQFANHLNQSRLVSLISVCKQGRNTRSLCFLCTKNELDCQLSSSLRSVVLTVFAEKFSDRGRKGTTTVDQMSTRVQVKSSTKLSQNINESEKGKQIFSIIGHKAVSIVMKLLK